MAYRASSCLKLSVSLIATACLGPLLAAPSALAADLDPGYADVPAAVSQQMVTFGSGWYVRGDLGGTEVPKVSASNAALGSPPDVTFSKSSRLGYSASLGAGYAFNNSIRIEAMADFHQPIQSSLQGDGFSCQNGYGLIPATATTSASAYATYGTCTGTYKASLKSFDALVNAYYDIGTWYGVTPYVGAGVGLGFGNYTTSSYFIQYDQTHYNLTLTNPVSGSTYHFNYDRSTNGRYYNFAWALMAGASYDLTSHAKLDVGYRYLNMGKVLNSEYSLQEVRAGLRYMIDN